MNANLKKKIVEITKALINENPSYHKHFTFLCRGNTVIAIGINNQNSTHPMNRLFPYKSDNIHSEMDAYIKVRWLDIDWKKITLINTRINTKGLFGYSKPCCGCIGLIKRLGIKQVYYTVDSSPNTVEFLKL